MKKFLSIVLSGIMVSGLTPQCEKVFAGNASEILCEKSSQLCTACAVIEGIMLIGSIGYIGYQRHLKRSKYNNPIKIRRCESVRFGDNSAIPIIDRILKYDIPRALEGEDAVYSNDINCIFELVLNRMKTLKETSKLIEDRNRLDTYKADFAMMCSGEKKMTIRQFVDMLKDIREMC